jgi:outer membrane protein assembly factor BamB
MDSLTATDMRTVGEFRLLARLGAGGMGQVFLASSLAGRVVAVKVIHAEHCRDPEFVRRFRGEVEAAQRVSGWYTAPVVAAGVDDTPPWLATAFVPGPPLDDIVSRHGPLPVAAVWRLAAGLAEALRAIHGTGLVHRDLKPANVLLAPDGPRVIDFGISRAVADTRLTASGAIIGTPSYMSPEQVEGAMAGPASDIFSLGSVLAYAATGTGPFNGAPGMSAAAVMYRVVHGAANLEGVPAELRGLIEACLAKDPAQRPDLARVASGSTAAAERLGLSPAAFWPPEVAGVIQAQQSALTAQIAALSGGAAPDIAGTFGPAGASTGFASPLPGGTTRPGAEGGSSGRHATGGGNGGPAGAGPSRRSLLIGGGAGGIAVIGGVLGWALSRSGAGASASSATGTGSTGSTGTQVVPTNSALQKYYGSGEKRSATWSFATGNSINANPGTGNGLVYIGSTDNSLYAVTTATGKKAWSYQTGAVTVAPQVFGGVVCVASGDGHFFALDAKSGAVAWTVDGVVPAYHRTWAVYNDQVIFYRTGAAMRAYDAATGAKGVSFGTASQYFGAPAVVGDVLYAVDVVSGALFAFHAGSGETIWQRKLFTSTSDASGGSGLLVSGGTIYLGTMSGTLYALDTGTGNTQWTYQPGNGIETELGLADGLVYVKDNNGNLHAVTTGSGKQAWVYPSVATGFNGLTVADGRVYFTTTLAVQAIDAKKGTAIWAFPAPAGKSLLSTPAVADGLVFIGCSDDALYAIKA